MAIDVMTLTSGWQAACFEMATALDSPLAYDPENDLWVTNDPSALCVRGCEGSNNESCGEQWRTMGNGFERTTGDGAAIIALSDVHR